MTKLRLGCLTMFGFAGLLTAAPAAMADVISVPMDEVRILAFATPVKTVYVGNPTIADITVIDSTHVFVLGKGFGTTNLVALDDRGRQTQDDQIVVLARQDSVVTLQRGAARSTLNCAGERCEAAPTPGDESAPFDTLTGQVEKRQTQNTMAASER